MDVLYPYKAIPDDRDLRWSLRSLVHMPHDRVIVAGDKPNVPGVVHVPVKPMDDPYMSSAANLRAGLDAVKGRKVIVMHDDIILLAPWRWQLQHRRTIREYLTYGRAKGSYRQMIWRTWDWLKERGCDEPLFYSLHTPAVYSVAKLRAVLDEVAGQSLAARTVYFNLHPEPAERAADVKRIMWRDDIPSMSMISLSDNLARRWKFQRWVEGVLPPEVAQ